MAATAKVLQHRPEVRCTQCGAVVFDGLAIKSRCVRVLQNGAEAMCKRCKRWVTVPITYSR